MNSSNHLHEAILLFSKATPEKQAKVLEWLRKEQAAKRYPLPESVSDLVENHIRDAAFELVAITKAIFSWSLEQKALPIEGGILDMDTGDIVSLSDMAIRRAQRIVELSNEFEGKVTSVGVKA
ncbi:hypothetical protein [Thiothrix eikelboomii]|uniref:hypothetical protein n=1 Tax=Thiothrix eikelboomii TaxID=92487 RepID=UPI003BB11043